MQRFTSKRIWTEIQGGQINAESGVWSDFAVTMKLVLHNADPCGYPKHCKNQVTAENEIIHKVFLKKVTIGIGLLF
jgi:hypothetical protein